MGGKRTSRKGGILTRLSKGLAKGVGYLSRRKRQSGGVRRRRVVRRAPQRGGCRRSQRGKGRKGQRGGSFVLPIAILSSILAPVIAEVVKKI